MRFLFWLLPILLVACSDVSPPPQPPPPGVPRPVAPGAAPHHNAESTAFPPNFAIVFTRQYGMWKYRTCTIEISLFLNTDRASLECVTTDNKHEKFTSELAGFDTTRLRHLAEAADLYGSEHIGEDLTPTDGTVDTLRFRPVAGGRAVVLVTSGNRSFEDEPARRDFLQFLYRIGADLREKGELASPGHAPEFR